MPTKFILSLIGIFLVLCVGTIGYMLIEGWTFLDALFMTVITITTVGFEEVNPLSAKGQIFTMVLIFSSIGIVTYGISGMVELMVEGNLKQYLWERRMEKMLRELSGHYIVCGAGQTGKSVIKELEREKAKYVAIDMDMEKVEALREHKIPIFHGDATDDEVLEKMHIRRAKGVITVLDNDADNVFAVLSCRQLNPNLHIVARAVEPSSSAKLKKAGADATVSPNEIGGQRMAFLVLKPEITNVLDIVSTNDDDGTINALVIKLDKNSGIIGKNLQKANVRGRTGLTVLAILRDHEKILNPSSEVVLREGDRLMVLGNEEQVTNFERL